MGTGMGWNTWKSWISLAGKLLLLFIRALISFPLLKSMDSPLFQLFPQPGSLQRGGEDFPGNSSCSSHEETRPPPRPALPKFRHHGHLQPICKQPEKPLENMENPFLFLVVSFHGFPAFPGVIFP